MHFLMEQIIRNINFKTGFDTTRSPSLWEIVKSILMDEHQLPRSYSILNSKGHHISLGKMIYHRPMTDDDVDLIKKYILELEDQRFYQHIGIDFRSIARAIVVDFKSKRIVQGGSTLTQQLVRNMFLGHRKCFSRKIKEIILAILMEVRFTKNEILRMYCNNVYMGNGIIGFQSASFAIHRKPINQINPLQIVSLVGLLRLPVKDNPYVSQSAFFKRTRQVQGFLNGKGFTIPDENLFKSNPIKRINKHRLQNLVSRELSDLDLQENIKTVRTSINSSFQRDIDNSLRKISTNKNISKVAFIALNRKAEIVAESSWGDGCETKFSVPTQGEIQPGSSLKPFLLLAALNQGKSLSENFLSAPYRKKIDSVNTWKVRNYQNRYHGSISLLHALGISDNTVFARLADSIDINGYYNLLNWLGLSELSGLTLSSCIGGLKHGVSLRSLAASYLFILNDGLYRGPRLITAVNSGMVTQSSVLRYPAKQDELFCDIKKALIQSGIYFRGEILSGKSGTTKNTSLFAGYTDDIAYVAWNEYRVAPNESDPKAYHAKDMILKMADSILGYDGYSTLGF